MPISNPRIELKFAFDERADSRIQTWINCHPYHFRVAYPDRWVNSLYFDNIDMKSMKDNFDGISNRKKVRYRWYGGLKEYSHGNLEFKIRKNSVGLKETINLKGIDLGHGKRLGSFLKNIREQLSADEAAWMDEFYWPIVIIRYFRRYFISADGLYRITYDRWLSSYSQYLTNRSNLLYKSLSFDLTPNVLEVKFSPKNYTGGSELVTKIPLRRSRFSKYVWASARR